MLTDEQLVKFEEEIVSLFNGSESLQTIFDKCRNIFSKLDIEDDWKLREFYCDFLSNFFLGGYYRYSEIQDIEEIKSNPFYLEYCDQLNMMDKEDPFNNLFFLTIDLIEKKHKNIIKKATSWIDAQIEASIDSNDIFDGFLFTFGLVTVLKEGFPGMWNEIGDILKDRTVEKGLPSMCYALEKFYYSAENEEIVDALTQVIQENGDLLVAKELLGYTYYEMKLWNNALAMFEQIEDGNSAEMVLFEDSRMFWMAWCYGKRRDYQNEEKYYRKTLEIYNDSEYALNNLGYSLYKQKKYHEAKDVFEKCIAENKDIDCASNNLVRTLLAMGEADEARTFIKNSKIHISKELVRRAEKAVQKVVPEKSELPFEDNAQSNKTVNLGVKKHQFSSEKILEDELVLRMESGISVFGMPLKVYQAKGAYGRQYIIPHGRIDILAVDDKGDYYVIELKKDSGYDDAYAQTKAYVDWIQKHLAKSKHKTYGIVCLNSPTKQLIEKVRNDDLIKLFEYNISYSEIQ